MKTTLCPFGCRCTLMIAGILFAGTSANATRQLLHTIPGQIGYSGGNPPVVDQLTYTLFYSEPQEPPFLGWPVRYGELAVNVLADGMDFEQGTFAFNATNSEAFPEFATFATNGTVDDLLVGGIEHDAYSGAWSTSTEQGYGWAGHASAQLSEVRLVIDSLTFSTDRTAYWTDYHWEFWSQTVPEPGTVLVAAVFFGLALARRHKLENHS